MIYVISKATFGSYNVRDIQCNANWDCCPYSDYALIPDELVDGILATKGYCDIVLNEDDNQVASFTAREIPSVPEECCGANTVLSVNGIKANSNGELTLPIDVYGYAYIENDAAMGDQCIAWFNALDDSHFGRYVINKAGQVYFIEIYRATAGYGVIQSTIYHSTDGATVSYGAIYGGIFTGFNPVSFQNHNHDDRYYTEEEIDEKFANVSSGGSAGMLREFSVENNTGSYTTTGNKSKFYIVTLTVGGYAQSLTVDYKSVSATTGKIRDFRVPDSQYTLRVTINSDDTVTFDLGTAGTINHVTGYY